jgi:formate dehydrogenase maturation protein FdhE
MYRSERFWCSNCDAHSRCKIGWLISGRDMETVEPNYCPKCGTKVAKE